MFKISGQVVNFMTRAVENWRVALDAGEQILWKVKI